VYVLPVPGGHHQEEAVLALGDRLGGRVDGVALVVPRLPLAAVVEVVLEHHVFLISGEALPPAVDRPQPGRRGEAPQRQGGLNRRQGAGAIVEDEAIPVRGEDKGDVQDLGVFEGLLHPVTDGVIVHFRLDNRDGDVRLEVEDVVRKLGFATGDHLAADMDLSVGEVHLASNLGRVVPARVLHMGRDELRADVRFTEVALTHPGSTPRVGPSQLAPANAAP
jgi:hypothetical protein